MSKTVNNIFPNQTSTIPYNALLTERILFDFRRGLPIFLDHADGFFIKPTEFLDPSLEQNIITTITGNADGQPIITNNQNIPNIENLLKLIKLSELTPSISIYPCDDLKLKQCVVNIKLDQLDIFTDTEFSIEKIVETPLPTSYYEECTLVTYRVYPGFYEYYALIIGKPDLSSPVNIRLHAECLTGDLLGSLRCDCRSQLHKALKDFAKDADHHGGVIIYIRQEGRNIGLLNKMKAYDLQNKGYDTVDANLMLGFKIDERDYQAASLILKDIGISSVNIFTNNPTKIASLEKHNITIANRVAHYTEPQKYNKNYMQTKKERIGHLPE